MELNIAVIGTIFIDCKGFACQGYNPRGRNLGNVKFVHGGVGRNVAENMAFLKLPVFFISTVDSSSLGNEVIGRLRKANINLDYISYTGNMGMGVWLALLDHNGDLAGSVSQMPDLSLLEKVLLEKGHDAVERSSHIVLEIDLNESISRRVIETARMFDKKVYGIPGNLQVIMSNQDLLRYTDCFICNDIEAGHLTGMDLNDKDVAGLIEVLVDFADKSAIPSMVITIGPRGSVYYDSRTGEKGYQPAIKTEVIDSSGAGDAFFSGTVMGLIRDCSLGEAVALGTKMASWTIQVEENTCQEAPAKIVEEEMFLRILSRFDGGVKSQIG